MLQLQLFMLFGLVAIFSLSLSDVDQGDVHVFCERFKDGQPSHCTCTINKTEVDSEKCDRSHPVQAVTIDRTRDGITTVMCHFASYTAGAVHSSHPDATCSLGGSRDDEYILKFDTIAKKPRDEGAHINCNVSCLDANFEQGLTISYEGVPIQFENTGDTSTASGLPVYALVIIIFVSVVVVVNLIIIVRKKRQEGFRRWSSTDFRRLPVTIKKAAPQPNAYEEAWDIKYNMTLAGALGGPQSPHNVGPKGDDYAMVSNAENKTTITVGPKGDEYSTVATHGKGGTRKVQLQGPKEAMNMEVRVASRVPEEKLQPASHQ